MIFAPFLQFVFGAMVGSFLNVLIFRYDPDKPLFHKGIVGGRSHCPHCGRTLRWFELIPLLSYFLQLGKCRTCRGRLSVQYPLIELLAGFEFLYVPSFISTHYGLRFLASQGTSLFPYYFLIGLWVLVVLIFLVIAAIDFRLTIIPDETNILLAVIGIAIAWIHWANTIPREVSSFLKHYHFLFGGGSHVLITQGLGILVGGGLFALIVFFTRGRGMGMGDVKLGVAGGILFGWPDIGLMVLLAFVLGAIAALPALLLKKKSLKDGIPFGPFIVLGMLVTMFLGPLILRGYFMLFPV